MCAENKGRNLSGFRDKKNQDAEQLESVPAIPFKEMPVEGEKYLGAGLRVNISESEFSEFILMLGSIAKGGYSVNSKFIGSWDLCQVSAVSKQNIKVCSDV